MKYSKKDLDDLADSHYTKFICTYGLVNALRVVKRINKLLKDEKRRRKNE